jgi:hypothetical protein
MKLTKYVAAAAATVCLALSLSGCVGQSESNQSAESSSPTVAIDFDGAMCHDTGKGTMYLQTQADRTTKKHTTASLEVSEGTTATQISVNTKKMTKKTCDVYIDGVMNTTIKPGTGQYVITLNDNALATGKHKVEVVHDSNGVMDTYKTANYKVVAPSDSSSSQ